jgi:hypothetical protein
MDPLTCRAIPSPRENFAWLQVTTVYIFYMPPLAVTSPAWDGDRTHTICRCAIQCSPLLPQRPHFQGICLVGKSPISRNHLRSLELRSRIPLLKNNILRKEETHGFKQSNRAMDMHACPQQVEKCSSCSTAQVVPYAVVCVYPVLQYPSAARKHGDRKGCQMDIICYSPTITIIIRCQPVAHNTVQSAST